MPVAVKHLEKPGSKHVDFYLAKWSDGLFYKAQVLEHDQEFKRCLLKFEDDTQHWMGIDGIHAILDTKHFKSESSILCCICNDGKSEEPNLLLICDLCQQAYHVECHKPAIDLELVKPDDLNVPWSCATCSEYVQKDPRLRRSSTTACTPKRKKSTSQTTSKTSVKKPNMRVKLNRRSAMNFGKVEPNSERVDDDLVELIKPDHSQDVGIVEDMSPVIINVAKTLATGAAAAIDTKDFLDLITEDVEATPATAENDEKAKPTKKKVSSRKAVRETKDEGKIKVAPAS